MDVPEISATNPPYPSILPFFHLTLSPLESLSQAFTPLSTGLSLERTGIAIFTSFPFSGDFDLEFGVVEVEVEVASLDLVFLVCTIGCVSRFRVVGMV